MEDAGPNWAAKKLKQAQANAARALDAVRGAAKAARDAPAFSAAVEAAVAAAASAAAAAAAPAAAASAQAKKATKAWKAAESFAARVTEARSQELARASEIRASAAKDLAEKKATMDAAYRDLTTLPTTPQSQREYENRFDRAASAYITEQYVNYGRHRNAEDVVKAEGLVDKALAKYHEAAAAYGAEARAADKAREAAYPAVRAAEGCGFRGAGG